MLSTVQTTLVVKEGKYLYDITDHRGQENLTIITWDSFIARLGKQNNSSSLPGFWDNSMGKRLFKKSTIIQGLESFIILVQRLAGLKNLGKSIILCEIIGIVAWKFYVYLSIKKHDGGDLIISTTELVLAPPMSPAFKSRTKQ